MRLLALLPRVPTRLLVIGAIASVLAGVSTSALVALVNALLREDIPHPGAGARFAGLSFIVLATTLLSTLTMSRFSSGVIADLALLLARRIVGAPLRTIESIGPPKLLAMLTDDCFSVAMALAALANIATSFVVVIGCLVSLAILSGKLLVAFVVFSLAGLTVVQVLMARSQRHAASARDALFEVFGQYDAITGGTKELMLHAKLREAFLEKKLALALARHRQLGFAVDAYVGAAGALGNLLFFAAIALLVFFGRELATVPTAVLAAFVVTILYLMGPITRIVALAPQVGRGVVALRGLDQIGLSLAQSEAPVSSSPVEPGAIELRGVTHAYFNERENARFELGPIDLRVMPGEILFVVGGNGSGKSTLVKVLVGLYAPEAGSIAVAGVTIDDASREAYRQHFAAVFADFHLISDLGLLGALDIDERARAYLRALHLDHKVRIEDGVLSTVELSSGQRKRLALLVAYLEDRPVYVFDEWASDQDPAFKEVFYKQILPDLRARGKTVIAVTHDDRYFGVADQLIKLEDGRVVETRRQAEPSSIAPTPAGDPRRYVAPPHEQEAGPPPPLSDSWRLRGSLRARLAIAIVALALFLRLPVLGVAFYGDDQLFLDVLTHVEPPTLAARGPLDLYRFSDGDAQATGARLATGVFPWWTDPTHKLAFMRPLTSATMWLDHALFDRSALPAHAVSLLWLAAMLGAAALAMSRSLPPSIAGLAFVIFALGGKTVPAAVWWCNRHVFVALTFAFASLSAHLSWRERGFAPGRWLSPVLLALGLLGGESAASVIPYLAAYELTRSTPRSTGAARALVGVAVVCVAYGVARVALHYGTARVGSYIDPMNDPVRYLAGLSRLPLVACLVVADALSLVLEAVRGLVRNGIVLAVLGGLTWLLVRAKASLPEEWREVRWLLAGAAFGLLPALAATQTILPALIGPMLGASAALALAIRYGYLAVRRRVPSRGAATVLAATLAIVFAFFNLVAPLAAAPLVSLAAVQSSTAERDVFQRYDVGGAVRDVVVLSSDDAIVPPSRNGKRSPIHLLALGADKVRAARIGERSISVQAESALFAPSSPFRATRAALHAGDEIAVGPYRVVVREVDGPAVTAADFHFDRSLDDASLAFFVTERRRATRVAVPAIGSAFAAVD